MIVGNKADRIIRRPTSMALSLLLRMMLVLSSLSRVVVVVAAAAAAVQQINDPQTTFESAKIVGGLGVTDVVTDVNSNKKSPFPWLVLSGDGKLCGGCTYMRICAFQHSLRSLACLIACLLA